MKLNCKFILSCLLVTATITAWSQQIPSKPNPPRLVNDYAGVLSPDEEQRLEQKLVSLDDSTSNQIAIVLIKTLNGYPKEDYAIKLFREWGIGNKKTNNGVLILAAIEDRQVRIEVGYGLEGAITDATAYHIYEDDLKPNFRNGDYYEGLEAAANQLINAARGEYKTPRKRKGEGGGAFKGMITFVIIMVVLFASRRGGGGGGGGFMSRRGYRGGWLGPFIIGSMLGRGSSGGWGGGGGGGWSGGGGGFGGFGGGSSGGGGAGGSW